VHSDSLVVVGIGEVVGEMVKATKEFLRLVVGVWYRQGRQRVKKSHQQVVVTRWWSLVPAMSTEREKKCYEFLLIPYLLIHHDTLALSYALLCFFLCALSFLTH
jgi:hypothetical protein